MAETGVEHTIAGTAAGKAWRWRGAASVALKGAAWGPLLVCALLYFIQPVARVGISARGPGAVAGATREMSMGTGANGLVLQTLSYRLLTAGPSYAPAGWSIRPGVRVGRQRMLLSPRQQKQSADVLGVMWGGGTSVVVAPTGAPQQSRGDGWLVVPWWLLLASTAVAPALRVARSVRNGRRAEREYRGQCPECGYDLRATPGRCPECGRLVER